MKLFRNDIKHDYECQVQENARKQEIIHNQKNIIKDLEEQLEKQRQANKILQAKIEQLKNDFNKLLEVVKNGKTRAKSNARK